MHETLHILEKDLQGIDSEVIVIDNGSTDECRNFATIRNEFNRGVSVGKNQGIAASKGEYILLLDGDIVPVPNSINCLIEWLDKNIAEDAIGFYPNKFSDQRNTESQRHHETYCHTLHEPKIHSQVIAFYGMFRSHIFENIRFPEDGPFGVAGYGWEDSDLYYQMKAKGIKQWVAGINHATGRYYHEINSSIRLMGQDEYMRTSRERAECFKNRWGTI